MTVSRSTLPHHARRRIAAAVLAFAATACGHAAEPAVGTLRAERGWLRATPPNAAVAGGYVTLRNAGTTDDRLVAITSPDAARVELHQMRMNGGAMQMRALPEGIAVKAGQTVELKPGGTHLMFIGPTRAFEVGEQVQVTLNYAHAPTQTLAFPVQPLGSREAPAMDMPADGGHGHH